MAEFDFGSYTGSDDSLMTVNDLNCTFNMPKVVKTEPKFEIRLTLLNETVDFVKEGYYNNNRKFKTKDDADKFTEELRSLRQYSAVDVVQAEEEVSGLPPYAPRKAFKVDEYNCPVSWMHGSGLASSYFVPIESEHGMWLDFNRNSQHKHHVAVLISVQGVNPLDGQSMVEGALSLKQYKTKCPVHDVEFGGDRFCPQCGYKWVPQNYLCTTGTPSGSLWLDGFLAADGVVRQYYFTENEALGVAHQVIGAEKKVYSIGIAFYLSKNPKPVPQYVNSYRGGGLESFGMAYTACAAAPAGALGGASKGIRTRGMLKSARRSLAANDATPIGAAEYDAEMEDAGGESLKSLDIAAGNKISQKVYADPEGLDFWQEKPAGVLYVNYTPKENAIAILKKGKKDLTKGGEGFLAGLKKGK